MIKTIIAEDQVILRESLKRLIEQDPEIAVVGCAENGREAFELCRVSSPDVVLMDIVMPHCDGVEGTRLIKEAFPEVKVIILTTFDDDKNIKQALENGADGYMLKIITPDDLILAIKSAAKGMGVMDKNVLQNVVKRFEPSTETSSTPESPHLTPREMDLIRLIVDGKSNKEIGAGLCLTEGSVKNLVTGVLDKFNLKDRTQLAVYAVKNRLV